MPHKEESSIPIQSAREATIRILCDHFARDAFPVEELERRLDLAHRAGSREELRRLLADLPSGDEVPAVVESAAQPARAPTREPYLGPVRDNEFAIAIMGGCRRAGTWIPARKTFALGMWGGVELDFRTARLPPGVTEVHAAAVMGGVDIVVAPGTRVESHGFALMAGFDNAGEGEAGLRPDEPVIRVSGFALMGGVAVSVRYPGESTGDARRRRRRERKEERRARRRLPGRGRG